MGFTSITFNPADIATASDAASDALSKAAGLSNKLSAASLAIIVNQSAASDAASAAAAASDKASKASVAAAGVASAASDAQSAAADASAAASNALSKAAGASGLLTSAVFSDPGDSSFVVKNIVITTSGEIKYRYSTTAVGD